MQCSKGLAQQNIGSLSHLEDVLGFGTRLIQMSQFQFRVGYFQKGTGRAIQEILQLACGAQVGEPGILPARFVKRFAEICELLLGREA